MKRGDVWVVSRLGYERKIVIVGNDDLTVLRPSVLTVPISDVMPPALTQPIVTDADGVMLGVAQAPRVGEIHKSALKERIGVLSPSSVEFIDMALRAALALTP